MKKYIIPAILVIIAFFVGFYVAGGFDKKLNYQQIAFEIVDANDHCWNAMGTTNVSNGKPVNCDRYPTQLAAVLAKDPKRVETKASIKRYLELPANTNDARSKAAILAVVNQ